MVIMVLWALPSSMSGLEMATGVYLCSDPPRLFFSETKFGTRAIAYSPTRHHVWLYGTNVAHYIYLPYIHRDVHGFRESASGRALHIHLHITVDVYIYFLNLNPWHSYNFRFTGYLLDVIPYLTDP
ncbi:uncharacterized protein F4812DRAFT_378392 [Daldinia caldariorum]|uniref:uncharacterized protein n=1 Tax=Daldinia caldariorum TaxID=326644 RepID=UPI0020083E78|nr:uncharacterized protein F4812DRAFT_378392 [Daldinia caldariorum]KAI1467843.1 hypothetical protein F4812DRAFT_378392 [Daldinia caldariorum]